MLQSLVIESQTPLQWLLANLQVLGWPTLMLFCWWFRGKVDRFTKSIEHDRVEAREILRYATETKAGVDLLATNHTAHIQKSVDDLGYKQDAMLALLSTKQDKTLELLASIDKNICLMADRLNRKE